MSFRRSKNFIVDYFPDSLYHPMVSLWRIFHGVEDKSPFDLDQFTEKFERYFKIEETDTCLDVGAYIGDTTIPIAIKAREGLVVAIEPEPGNLDHLRKNTRHFTNVEIVPVAIGEHDFPTVLHLSKRATGHSLVSHKARRRSITTPCTTLNHFAWLQFNFAKIDVQGAETFIFKSASKFLESTEKLIVETHDYSNENRTLPYVLPWLKPHFPIIHITDKGVVHCAKRA